MSSEDEALAFLNIIRSQSKDASHHCFAYTIGANMGIMRYSDDGEPSGTAGLPMMEVIKREKVCNVCVVVTRYFGGILLGAGGLLRAYTQGCSIGLKAGKIVTMEPTTHFICEIPYSLWDKLQYQMKSLPVQISSTDYGKSVTFTLLVRDKDTDSVMKALDQASQGQFFFIQDTMSYEAWD